MKNKKNIIINSTESIYSKETGGLGIFTNKFAKLLCKLDYKVTVVVCSDVKKKIIKNNIDYIFLKIDNLFFKILKKISHIIYLIVRSLIYNYHLKCIINKKNNIKLIHFPNYGFLQLFYKNAKIKTSCRISSLEYLWNSNKNYIYLFFTSYLEKKCLKKANIIFTPSTFLKKKLYQRFKLNSYYLPQIYEESKIKKTKIKKKFILIIGSISSGKGGDYIADNINNILPSSMNLIWIGNIDKNYISSHSEYQKKLKNKLKENLNRKIYIKKFIKQNKLMEYINSSSLVLFPAFRENSPNSLLETIGQYKFFIARKNVGYDDFSIKNKNCFLFDDNNGNQLKKLIKKYLKNKRKYDLLGKINNKKLIKKFTENDLKKKITFLLRKI